LEENKNRCIFCGQPSNEIYICRDGYSYLRCKYCGLVYLRPQPSQEELRNFYNITYQVDFKRYKKNMLSKARRSLKEISKFAKPGSLLELGCSYGFFLKKAKENGWTVKGLEWSGEARDYAVHQLNLDVSAESLSEFTLTQRKFDVVTAWHVLEHLTDPQEELANIRKILNPKGIFLFTTPNIDSLQFRLLGSKWEWFSPPAHLYIFGISSINHLLKKNGFEILKLETRRGDSKGLIFQCIHLLLKRTYLILTFPFGEIFKKTSSKESKISNEERHESNSRNPTKLLKYVYHGTGEKVLFFITEVISPITFPLRKIIYKKNLGPEMLVIARKAEKNSI
jgi:2-polyprenyl-3-methyl-5-hydroxy-6-metoxy-1,4-benzoquinol methylase